MRPAHPLVRRGVVSFADARLRAEGPLSGAQCAASGGRPVPGNNTRDRHGALWGGLRQRPNGHQAPECDTFLGIAHPLTASSMK